MGKRRIKAAIEAAVAKVYAAADEGQAAGVDARRALAKFEAMLDVGADMLDDLEEHGLYGEVSVAGYVIPIRLNLVISEDDQG